MNLCNESSHCRENRTHPFGHKVAPTRGDVALTWCPAISKLGLPGPRQLKEREEVAGVPVPVQVGVQTRLLTPRRIPWAVLEAQLIVDLEGAHKGCHRWQQGAVSHKLCPLVRSSSPLGSTHLEGQWGCALLEVVLEDNGSQHAARAVVQLDVLLKVPLRGKALSCRGGKDRDHRIME